MKFFETASIFGVGASRAAVTVPSIMGLFTEMNGGTPLYQHPSITYLTAAQGTVQTGHAWTAQGGATNVTFAPGQINIANSASNTIVRHNLLATIPTGTKVHVQCFRRTGTTSFSVRLGPTNQNAGAGNISGWKSAAITTNSAKTYIEIVQNANGGAAEFGSVCVEAFDEASVPFDIYIMAGQSNMAGASSGDAGNINIDVPHPNVFARWGSSQGAHWVTDGGISRARESFISKVNSLGFSPILSFGRYIAENYLTSGRKVLLLGSAQGGTSLTQAAGGWNPSGSSPTLINDAIADALAAKALNPANVIKGFIWCQGESDRGASGASNYQTKFPELVTYVRASIPGVPVCILGLNPYRAAGLAVDTNTTDMIAMQATFAVGEANAISGVCYSGWNIDWGNGTKSAPDAVDDEVHFGTDANRLRGVAAAIEFINLVS
jgi:hypothetical protein